jgi:hypothetical protein
MKSCNRECITNQNKNISLYMKIKDTWMHLLSKKAAGVISPENA